MPLLRYDESVQADGRERSIHETSDLPVAAYHDNAAVHPVAWHWHDEFELFHLLAGSVHFLIGTSQLTLAAGDAIFVNAGLLHGAWDDHSPDCRYHSLVFHPELIGGAQTSVFWQNYVDPLRLNKALPYLVLHADQEWQRRVIGMIEEGWESMTAQEPGFEFRVRGHGLLYQMLSQRIRHDTAEIPSGTAQSPAG